MPKVLYVNGKLYIVDGNHRTIGAIKADLTSIQYEVLIGATESEAMNLFMTQGQDRSKMKPQDTYNAALQAKRPEYVRLKEICNKNHVAVKGDRKPVENPIGILTPVLDGVKMAKSNPEHHFAETKQATMRRKSVILIMRLLQKLLMRF